MTLPLLVVKELSKKFSLGNKILKAVDSVSFELVEGEIFGIGGESGCGKSTLGKLLLRLIDPSSGKVFFMGQDLTALSHKALKPFRRQIQAIFQHPASSLNPRMTIGQILSEPFEIHGLLNPVQRKERLIELLTQVGLSAAFLNRLPEQLSGGQKQRIAIARALALNPRLIICDEPFSALDLSVQGQLLNLMKELQQNLKLSYLLISHDLAVMRHFTHRLAIMYAGQFVELGPSNYLYENPSHPYTEALLEAVPTIDLKREKNRLAVLKGEVPSLVNPLPGCPFQSRCPYALPICKKEKPILKETRPHHWVACHRL